MKELKYKIDKILCILEKQCYNIDSAATLNAVNIFEVDYAAAAVKVLDAAAVNAVDADDTKIFFDINRHKF